MVSSCIWLRPLRGWSHLCSFRKSPGPAAKDTAGGISPPWYFTSQVAKAMEGAQFKKINNAQSSIYTTLHLKLSVVAHVPGVFQRMSLDKLQSFLCFSLCPKGINIEKKKENLLSHRVPSMFCSVKHFAELFNCKTSIILQLFFIQSGFQNLIKSFLFVIHWIWSWHGLWKTAA